MKNCLLNPLFLMTLSSLVFHSLTVKAQDNEGAVTRPYHFSGPCTSQGSWTQAALYQTQRLRELTLQLRDDPSCKALGQSVQGTLRELEKELDVTSETQVSASSAATLPQEISAIAATISGGVFMKQVLAPLLFGKMISMAKNQSDNSGAAASVVPGTSPMANSNRQALIESFQQRIRKSAQRGLRLFNSTIDALPQLQTCLTSDDSMGQVFSSSISMLGALVSSGQDPTGNQTALAISKISSYLREKRFNNVLARLNKIEFMSTVSCMMEITSESYCSARDGRILFNQMVSEMSQQIPQNRGSDNSPVSVSIQRSGPLAGYYVLTQHVPVISTWLYKIQIGNSPRLEEDALFQTKILKSVNEYFIQMKSLEGYFYNQVMNLPQMPDRKAKQNLMRETVLALTEAMIKTDGMTNFFLITNSPPELPFRLIGIPIPAQVLGTVPNLPRITAQDWLDQYYTTVPEFQDPDALALRMENNLKAIREESTSAAIAYYNKNYIVDQTGIVNESLLGMSYNVKDSLLAIDRYLAQLKDRIEKSAGDKTIIGSIVETRIKIGRVFARYKALKEFSERLPQVPFASAAEEEVMKEQLKRLNLELVNEVYLQFEVLLARTGWLANRMATYALTDYQLTMKQQIENPQFFNRHVEELFYASGQLAFDRMLQMANGNPANVDSDLNAAMKFNKENMAALEMLVGKNLTSMINGLRLASTKSKVTSKDITFDSIRRAYKDQWQKTPDDNRNVFTRFFAGLWNSTRAALGFDKSRYPIIHRSYIGLNNNEIYSTDDEFQSAQKLYTQLCVQALAFQDLRGYWEACRQVKMISPYAVSPAAAVEGKKYQEYLSVSFVEKAYEELNKNRGLNQSKRICAFRDYNRRNLVAYLTAVTSSPTSDRYENEHTRLPEVIHPLPAAPTRSGGSVEAGGDPQSQSGSSGQDQGQGPLPPDFEEEIPGVNQAQ